MTTFAANHPAVRSRSQSSEPGTTRSVTTPGAFRWLLLLVITLNVIGLVMVLSSSSVQGVDDFGSTWGYFERQILWSSLGATAMYLTFRMDYRAWRRLRLPLMAVTLTGLVLVMVPGLGRNVNGASRWLGAGPFTVQPSEIAKLAVLVYVADLLARRTSRLVDPHATLWPVLAIFGVVGLLVLIEPDLGTTLILAAIVGALLWVHGAPMRWMMALLGSGAAATFVLGMAAGYRRARLLAFMDPWADAQNTGYQTIQSLLGLGSGGIFGVGLGSSRAKWGFLPNAHTDFIFAIIGEELGLIGALAVLVLFVGLTAFGIKAAMAAPDRFGTLLAAGVTTWILLQALVNIGAVIGVLPVTGVPLPFVSFGGSSLVVTMAATGILLNVARQGVPARPAR